MILKILTEGLILGGVLVMICAWGIHGGAERMVFLYHQDVQQRCIENGLITSQQIRKNRMLFKGLALPLYLLFALFCAYAVNGARGFVQGFLHMYGIFFIVNLIDRFLIDDYWVLKTKAWDIPGTEDLKPYITGQDKAMKWIGASVGFAVLSALLSLIMLYVTGA